MLACKKRRVPSLALNPNPGWTPKLLTLKTLSRSVPCLQLALSVGMGMSVRPGDQAGEEGVFGEDEGGHDHHGHTHAPGETCGGHGDAAASAPGGAAGAASAAAASAQVCRKASCAQTSSQELVVVFSLL